MYLWAARFVFPDNRYEPDAAGAQCSTTQLRRQYDDVGDPSANANLGRLLSNAGVSWAWYAEGYAAMRAAGRGCPSAPRDCPASGLRAPPCVFEPGDIPPEYYPSSVDHPGSVRDYSRLAFDVAHGRLPSVVFVKALGYRTEHPGQGQQITPGAEFVRRTIDTIERSRLAGQTLVILTYDESGGFYDHVAPPPTSAVDGQPYGPRIPTIAIGPLARTGVVSHTQLEAASIVKFVEWNWLHGVTGQLGGRDATVHNLGSLVRSRLGVPN
jgi:phospholipase C